MNLEDYVNSFLFIVPNHSWSSCRQFGLFIAGQFDPSSSDVLTHHESSMLSFVLEGHDLVLPIDPAS